MMFRALDHFLLRLQSVRFQVESRFLFTTKPPSSQTRFRHRTHISAGPIYWRSVTRPGAHRRSSGRRHYCYASVSPGLSRRRTGSCAPHLVRVGSGIVTRFNDFSGGLGRGAGAPRSHDDPKVPLGSACTKVARRGLGIDGPLDMRQSAYIAATTSNASVRSMTIAFFASGTSERRTTKAPFPFLTVRVVRSPTWRTGCRRRIRLRRRSSRPGSSPASSRRSRRVRARGRREEA